MKLNEDHLYHIYNQGNNQESVFKEDADYLRFLTKVKILIAPYCNILAYCLMPNHFHFLVHATPRSCQEKQLGNITTNLLSNGFRLLLSEYAQEYNLKHNRTGSLFRQKTKSKCLTENQADYALTCYHYIHQNPMKANLVNKMEDWNFSSFHEFLNPELKSICNLSLCYSLLEIVPETFYKESYGVIDEATIEHIYIK